MREDLKGKSTKPYFVGSFGESIKIGYVLSNELPEPKVCKTFGCKKHLTLIESLCGEYCLKCNYDNQLKNKQNIYQ